MPHCSNKLREDCVIFSKFLSNSKLNCHVWYLLFLGNSPYEFVKVIPNCIIFNESTFIFNVL